MSGKLCESALYGLLKNDTVMRSPIEFHDRSNKLAVIIDPRFDDMMEAVIRNFMYYMNPEGWNLLIISWSGHRKTIGDKFPNSLFGEIDNNLIYNDANSIPNITIDTYNKILMNVEFWHSLPADHVVIFQKDCIMFKMFPDYFRLYDFSGANWYTQNNTIFNDGINGGFSIRNRNSMIECLQKISFDMIEQYRKDALTNQSIIFKTMSDNQRIFLQSELSKKNEDVFFSYACELLHKAMPDLLHRAFLAIEANIYKDTCVYHGWQHNYHSVDTIQAFLDSSEIFTNQ
jgi:hypothetical protein